MKKLLLIPILLLIMQVSTAQLPFHRGINLTGWFQASDAGYIQFRKFTFKDFTEIKSLGCDVIRLPVNLHDMTSGAPDYIIDPVLFSLLDSVISWAELLQMHLIIDNHSFDPSVSTSPDVGQILTRVWPQIASRYQSRSEFILYEILNEPHGISNQLWGSIQQQTIDAIRAVDTRHTIVVGPSGYNSYNDLAQMPVYADTNLIYTFHFYDPFLFTHQGASWSTPSMQPLAGVPFPYNADSMPPCPPELEGTWIEDALGYYNTQGNAETVRSLIDIAVQFRDEHNLKIFCGEFGVYIPNSDNNDRANWYELVKNYLEEKAIPWTIWDYKGGFGLFEKGSFELFESDLNIPLVEALGFNLPEQQPYSIKPDTVGFTIYDDYLGTRINEASYTESEIDYFSTLFPNNDQYCLYWSGGPQYSLIAHDFVPDRDLSQLVEAGYALDLMVRGNVEGISFDIRFLDTKTVDPSDHPWRIRTTLNDASPGWDKRWHHLHIPLLNFTEHGSWDNNTWYEPEGKFDWSAIDRMEIVAEYGSFENREVWFDNIRITDQDTANVIETGTLGIQQPALSFRDTRLSAWPNPMNTSVTLSFGLQENSRVELIVYSSTGFIIRELVNAELAQGSHSLAWDGTNSTGNQVPPGIYICRLQTENGTGHYKIIKTGSARQTSAF
ncbi:MAG: cellulase family glycosylhydrolase [Bacteroidales bacterium]|nr:cellulase family glycosylhydrolase [Bacteroidales bacterium]